MTMTQPERAAEIKKRGNTCFQKGKFNAAIDMYTEAILLDPSQSTFYSNRALCRSKLEQWAPCRDDCEQALGLDALNTKASYLLGVSHARLRAFEASIAAFQRALSSAEKTSKSMAFRQEIRVELRRARKQQWLDAQEGRLAHHSRMTAELAALFDANMQHEQANGADRGKVEQLDALMAYVEQLTGERERELYTKDIPDCFVCPVSMEIMLDPVTTPNGVSYERASLEAHLKANGAVDPLTRERLTLDLLRPNTSLRTAIEEYLDANPWAFEH